MDIYSLNKDNEKKINLCISNRCFIKCLGCYNDFCYEELISYHSIIEFLKYAKEKGLKKVTLSGGDPLAREDIMSIINKCYELGFIINLDTVGLPLIEEVQIIGSNKIISKIDNKEILKKINLIGIPIDGSNNDIISLFRISKDNLFEKEIKLLSLFEELQLNVCINTVYHKQNKDDMINIYNILKNYDCVKKWQVFQFMPIGSLGKQNESLYKVSTHEFKETSDIFKNMKRLNMQVEFKSSFERSQNYMLINSSGYAYKVNLNNHKEMFGNIKNKDEWDRIIKHLCRKK